jgi:hypothetical protein
MKTLDSRLTRVYTEPCHAAQRFLTPVDDGEPQRQFGA